jgi:Sporulation and spore germination
MSPTRRRVTAYLIATAVIMSIAGCTLPTDDEAQVLSGPEIESAMNPTTTSTTSAPGVTTTHDLFFFDGDDLLVAVPEETPVGDDITAVLNLLAPSDEPGPLRTDVPEGFLVSDTDLADDGTLTITVDDESLFELGGDRSSRAFAQIVVTAVAFEDVEQVVFELNDERRRVTMADGTSTDEPVDACDYVSFLPLGISCTSPGQSTGATTTSTTEPIAEIPGN